MRLNPTRYRVSDGTHKSKWPCKCPDNCKRSTTCSAQAGHYANHSRRNIGRVPPTLFLIGANGLVMFIPDNLADDSAKDDFATTARLMCIAHAATATVMTLEAWMKFTP